MTDTYSPNYGDPNEWPDVDSNGNIIYPITFGHNAPTDGPSRTPLKDLNGDTIYHVNPDGSLGDIWYTDEKPPPYWNASGGEPTGADVAQAVEAVGNNPDAIKSWLATNNFPTDNIPPPDFTPNVDDDFDAPPNGLDGLGAVGAPNNPTSVVP